MIALDTNLLLYAYSTAAPEHAAAHGFLSQLSRREDVVLSEPRRAHAGTEQFARRRLFDARTAVSHRQHGVTEFATANVKDFQDVGFSRVWNPLLEA